MSRRQIKIVPAVLEGSIEAIQEKVDMLAGRSKVVGVDIIDGVYTDNLTVGVADLALVDFKEMTVEVQLMTEYPTELLGECKSVGVRRVFGHIEKMGSQLEFVETASELGLKPGLALDLYTPLESLEREALEMADGVLLMSVKAGFSGQKFNELVLDKIAELRESGFDKGIQIDGGINPETLRRCLGAGADEFAVTSFLWQASDLDKALGELKAIMEA